MDDFILKIKLISPLITPLDADTIFGHICWSLRYIKGNKFVESFLKEFESSPKFLVSNGFPENFISVPVLPEIDYDDMLKMLEDKKVIDLFNLKGGKNKNNILTLAEKVKYFKKTEILPLEVFLKIADNLNEKSLFLEMALFETNKIKLDETVFSFKSEVMEVMHNSINRMNTSVSDSGRLYSQNETFYNSEMIFDIFFKIFDSEYIPVINEAMEFICINGYGKDKSVGKGSFKIEKALEKTEIFNRPGDFFMSLSPFIPDSKCTPVFYKIKTKFGKVFNDTGEYGKNFNPFKKPAVMLDSGSIFKAEKDDSVCGSIISDISTYEKVKQYALSYPIKINIV